MSEGTVSVKKNLTVKEGTTLEVGSDVKLTAEANDNEIKLEKGSTLKVEGTLGFNPNFSGEGTVELANSDNSRNGLNLRHAVENGANNFKVDTEAQLNQKLEVKPIVGDEGHPRTITISGNGNTKITTNSVSKNIAVASGNTLKVDGVDFEFNVNSAGAECFIVSEGTVDLKDSDIKLSSGYGIFVKGANGKLEMNGGSIISDKAPCIGTNNADTKNCTINVTNATLETKADTEPAVFLPAKGEATFTDCEIKGGSAIEALGLTTLNLKGNTKLVATLASYSAPSQASGSEASGSALLIVSRKGYNDGATMTLNIHNSVTFSKTATGSGHDLGDIEIFAKDNNIGINKVQINGASGKTISGNYSTHSVTMSQTPNAGQD